MKYIKTFEKIIRKEPAIILSAKKGSVSGVEKALKSGQDINTTGAYSRTALMEATINKYISVVDYLIKKGADVNLQDKDGETALMFARTSRILDLLLNTNVDVNIINYKGENVAMVYLRYETNSELFIKYLNIFLEKGLNLDNKNVDGNNLYDIVKQEEKIHTGDSYKLKFYFEVEEYMNNEFPNYKEDWTIKQDMTKYNI